MTKLEKVIKPVKGYEGYYEVDNQAKVYSVERIIEVHTRFGIQDKKIKQKELSQHIHPNGYMIVNLTKDGKSKSVRVHRIVAEAFISNPDNLPLVNHKDEDKTNNRPENLEWCTHQYNITYNGANKRAGNTKRGRIHTEEHKQKIAKGVKKYYQTHVSALKGRHYERKDGICRWI